MSTPEVGGARAEAVGGRHRIRLSVGRLPRLLAAIVVALVLIHVALRAWQFTGHEVPLDLQLVFDVDGEPTVPTWYSTITIFFCALLLTSIAGAKRRDGDRETPFWYGLAIGLAVMSLDEVAAIHENLNTFGSIDWTIPAAVMVLILAAVFLPFLLRLEKRTRRRFLIAGAIYIVGVLGVEAIAIDRELFPYSMDTFQYYLLTGLEESLEMAGILLFMRALLIYMQSEEPGSPSIALRFTVEK